MASSSFKISIIIPVYNVERYVQRCLDSILNQSYENIEIICIDDCSTDSSVRIIEEFIKQNNAKKIKLVKLQEHSGPYNARRIGINNSDGDYVLFVDADDYLDLGLVEELIKISKDNNSDIIHFSSVIENCGVNENRMINMAKFSSPLKEELRYDEIFKRCFCDYDYGWNLWNKLFKMSLCKRVVSMMKEGFFVRAEDALIYFFLSSAAISYLGIDTNQKYHYCLGNGVTGDRILTSGDFEKDCNRVKELIVYLHKVKISKIQSINQEIIDIAIKKLGDRLLKEIIELWIFNVPSSEKSISVGVIIKVFGAINLCDILFGVFTQYKNLFAYYLIDVYIFQKNYTASKRIAFYYKKYGKGGVERVISLLIPLFLRGGYGVILITEEHEDENDFFLPENVKRYVIPAKNDIDSGKISYRERGEHLLDIFEREQIDTVSYEESSSRYLLYDMIVSKSAGIKFIISKHELFSQHYVFNRDILSDEISSYPLADALTVLSSEEEIFWKTLGVQSFLIPNPLTVNKEKECEYDENKDVIVWIGRLDRNQKQYQDIVPIMKDVVKTVPEAVIKIYGSPETYKDLFLLKKEIAEFGLEKNIIYVGYVNSIQDIYMNAGIMLMTSAYESSPMVVIEAKQYGVPMVMYSMPYIETLKDGKGYIAVKQGDTRGAAKAIVSLLINKEYRNQLSQEAKMSLDGYSDNYIMRKWNDLLNGNIQRKDIDNNLYNNIIRTMIFHMSLGCNKYNELEKKYNELLIEKKISCIKQIIEKRGLKVAIYPFGALGRKLYYRFKSANIEVSLIVDNGNEKNDLETIKLYNIPVEQAKKFLFVVSSNNMKFYNEIRSELRKVVPEDNIFDWYPIDEL